MKRINPPRPAPAHFPYQHATLAQTDTSSPAAWRLANKPRFDALFGVEPDPELPFPRGTVKPLALADRLAAARAWRIQMKPHFDALYQG